MKTCSFVEEIKKETRKEKEREEAHNPMVCLRLISMWKWVDNDLFKVMCEVICQRL